MSAQIITWMRPFLIRSAVFVVVSLSFIGTTSGVRTAPSGGVTPVQAQSEYLAHFPLLARNDPLTLPPRYVPDADFVLGGPSMAVDVVGDVAFTGIGAHLVALDATMEGDDPDRVLGASVPLPGYVADIQIVDGLAYVAVAQSSRAEVDGGLFILDVEDPLRMEVIGYGPIPGGRITSHCAAR